MDIARVLNRIRPEAKWSLNGSEYKGLNWTDDTPKPTEKEIKDAWKEIEQELVIEKIQRLRRDAYQLESDPLFFEYQRGDIEKSVWIDKVKEIKDRYPYSGFSQE